MIVLFLSEEWVNCEMWTADPVGWYTLLSVHSYTLLTEACKAVIIFCKNQLHDILVMWKNWA